MANLSNINNKFLFTDGDFLKIGNLAPINNISGTESGISITNSNVASITLDNTAASGKRYIMYSSGNGSLVFWDGDAASARLQIDSAGNSTFAGNVTVNGSQDALTINTTDTDGPYAVWKNTTNATLGFVGNANSLASAGNTNFAVRATNDLVFAAGGGTERMRIDSSGHATFEGAVTTGNPLTITATSPSLEWTNVAGTRLAYIEHNNNLIYNADTGIHKFNQDATFAGSVLINGNGKVLDLTDGNYLRLGDNQDLQIVHTFGGDSIIDNFSGEFKIRQRAENINLTFGTYSAIEAMVIDSSGNVGIGTSSPDTLLEILGADPILTIRDTSTSGADSHATLRLAESGAGSTLNLHYDISLDEGALTFNYDNANTGSPVERMRIALDGNVGIGTTTITKKLEVAGDASTGTFRLRPTDGTYQDYRLDITAQAANDGAVTMAIKENIFLKTYGYYNLTGLSLGVAGYTDLIHLKNSGNVGIGTTAPTSLLEISKQLSAASTIDYPYTISSRDDGNSINQAGGEGVGIKFRIAGNAATTPGDSLVGASIAAIRESASDTDSSTGLGFFVTQNDETLDEALRIDHDGNVGIGTTDPGNPLHIVGNTAKLQGSGSGYTAWFITNSGTGNAGNYYDAINGDTAGGDYGFVGQNNSGYMSYDIGAQSPMPYHVFTGGNVGIGTTSPDALLEISGNAGADPGPITNPTTFRITDSGNAATGLGDTTNPWGKIEFYSEDVSASGPTVQTQIASIYDNIYSYASSLAFFTRVQPSTSLLERMRITSVGDVLVAKQSQGLSITGIELSQDLLRVTKSSAAPVEINRKGTDGNIVNFYKDTSSKGNISITTSAVAYNTSSDYRLKEDLQDFNGLDKVSKIKMYDFKWKTDESRSYGVMAHELQEVLPDAVSGKKDAEEMQGVDYSKIVPLLVKSIQELKADNDSLKARIETLENN